jgi:hypothetical protein
MTQHVNPENRSKIERAFWEFHRRNPHVYDELVVLAREMLRRGQRFGIATIYEVARWNTSGYAATGGPKLNNNYRTSRAYSPRAASGSARTFSPTLRKRRPSGARGAAPSGTSRDLAASVMTPATVTPTGDGPRSNHRPGRPLRTL